LGLLFLYVRSAENTYLSFFSCLVCPWGSLSIQRYSRCVISSPRFLRFKNSHGKVLHGDDNLVTFWL